MSSLPGLLVPPKSDPRWASLAAEGTPKPIKLLALKFMLTRMNQDIKRDRAVLPKCVDELHGFFVKNPKMVEADNGTLFG